MEGDSFNTIQRGYVRPSIATTPLVASSPKLSFITDDLVKKYEEPLGVREKCANAGLVFGSLALVSWIVILFGIFYSLAGITLSVVGLKSNRFKYARMGLVFSVIGLIASFWYAFAAYRGIINYNYFTSEFWEAASGVEIGVE
ncbi:MAG: hypothetical protein HZB12_00730 [Candidatus Yonathbacteria bacterium]|nr:hypothetical protein [Candidatus Yonathbacteria bacterium]